MASFKKDEKKIVKKAVSNEEKQVRKVYKNAFLDKKGIRFCVYSEKKGILLGMDTKSELNAWKKALHKTF